MTENDTILQIIKDEKPKWHPIFLDGGKEDNLVAEALWPNQSWVSSRLFKTTTATFSAHSPQFFTFEGILPFLRLEIAWLTSKSFPHVFLEFLEWKGWAYMEVHHTNKPH